MVVFLSVTLYMKNTILERSKLWNQRKNDFLAFFSKFSNESVKRANGTRVNYVVVVNNCLWVLFLYSSCTPYQIWPGSKSFVTDIGALKVGVLFFPEARIWLWKSVFCIILKVLWIYSAILMHEFFDWFKSKFCRWGSDSKLVSKIIYDIFQI